jgi:hypothetical protein
MSEADAKLAAGMPPGCQASILERFEWAQRVTNLMKVGLGGQTGVAFRSAWKYTELCVGDDVRFGQVRVPTPKDSGESLPEGASTMPVATSRKFHLEKRPKHARLGRSARDHGWCQVLAYAPTYFGSGNISSFSETNCQNQVSVFIQSLMQRKYRSTGTIVNYAGPSENDDIDGNVGKYTPLVNCVSKASDFRTRAYGYGMHAVVVIDATVFSGWILPGGCV